MRPVVISDYSGWEFKNGGTENAVQRAFRLITEGKDVRQGDVLFVIDQREYKDALDRAQAELTRAKTQASGGQTL